ncbi:MAG: hypothetical protein ACRDDF_01055 [Aeromonas sp.]
MIGTPGNLPDRRPSPRAASCPAIEGGGARRFTASMTVTANRIRDSQCRVRSPRQCWQWQAYHHQAAEPGRWLAIPSRHGTRDRWDKKRSNFTQLTPK